MNNWFLLYGSSVLEVAFSFLDFCILMLGLLFSNLHVNDSLLSLSCNLKLVKLVGNFFLLLFIAGRICIVIYHLWDVRLSLLLFIRNRNIFVKNKRLQEEDEKSFPKIQNVIKNKGKKVCSKIDHNTQHCYSNPCDLHIKI